MEAIIDLETGEQIQNLLDRVERGEEVTIIRHGKPVARLVPVHSTDPDLEALVRERHQRAADGLRELGAQLRLDGLTIRDLIDEGRRY
jgi:prevent-host-death family protein